MLTNIKCSTITSLAIHLEFDDKCAKDCEIHLGDLIEVEYNRNGCFKQFQGKIVKISCPGNNPKDWSILVDGSGDFSSDQARICPMNIYDLEVLVKASNVINIQTTNDRNSCNFIRVVKGRLQYSVDGVNWEPIIIDRRDIAIKDEEGTVPPDKFNHHHCNENSNDSIQDETM